MLSCDKNLHLSLINHLSMVLEMVTVNLDDYWRCSSRRTTQQGLPNHCTRRYLRLQKVKDSQSLDSDLLLRMFYFERFQCQVRPCTLLVSISCVKDSKHAWFFAAVLREIHYLVQYSMKVFAFYFLILSWSSGVYPSDSVWFHAGCRSQGS